MQITVTPPARAGKVLLVMKLCVTFLLAFTFAASARNYAQQVTVKVNNGSLEQVFKQIEGQCDYSFVYTKTEMQKAKLVTIDVKQMQLLEVLKLAFKDQSLSFTIRNNFIVVRAEDEKVEFTPPPPITVKGKVVDENGNPVRAAVLVKGSNKGTVTDDKGEFTLANVDPDAVLLIASVAIERKYEVPVSGRTYITINVQSSVKELDTFSIKIGTGYAQVSKERFTGSAVSIDSSLFQRELSSDVISRLENIASGLQFRRSGGSYQLQIRGVSTIDPLSNYDPLLIVNDFPYYGDINNINPNEVENVTILKDAAAASIWGSRAGNGVIVITTKKGKYNQPIQISYSSNIRVQEKPNLYYLPTISVPDYVDIQQFLFSRGFYDANLLNSLSYPIVPQVAVILDKQRQGKISASEAQSQIAMLKTLDIRNDYLKYLIRNEVSQQHFLAATGGSDRIRYNFSLGYDHKLSGTIANGNQGDSRYTFSSNISFKPSTAFEITTGLNVTQSTSHNGDIGQTIEASPYTQLADIYGNPLPVERSYSSRFTDTAGAGKLLDWRYYPLKEIQSPNHTNNLQYYAFNTGMSLKLSKWLKASGKVQLSKQLTTSKNYKSVEDFETRDLINRYTTISNGSVTNNIPIGGILDFTNNEIQNYNIRGQLDFNKKIGSQHEISAMVAGEISQANSAGNSERIYGYDEETGSYATFIDYASRFPQFIGGSSQQIPTGLKYTDGNINRIVSLITNVSYNFHNRYSIYASARRDAANIFGVKTNERWKPLWSIGGSWDLSKESFVNVKWLSSLKLRTSYGYSGNLPAIAGGGTSTLYTFGYTGYLSPFTSTPYAYAGHGGSGSLRWETVGMFNIGIDIANKTNRISGSFEWFWKKSTDLIAEIPIDPTLGYLTTYKKANVASLAGQGFELSIRTRNLTGKIQWNTSLNLSYSKMIVKQFFINPSATYIDNGINPREGGLAFGIYSYRWAGLDPTNGDPIGYLGKQTSKNYQAIFLDSFQNQVFNGSSVPLYFGNILNSFSWKGFSVSFNISFQFDYYFRKPVISYTSLFNGITNTGNDPEFYHRWQNPGDERVTNVPSMTYPFDSNRDRFYKYSEINVVRGDHIRLQDVRIDFPAWVNKHSKNNPIKRAQFYLYPGPVNILLWKKNDIGVDPLYSNGSYSPPPPTTWSAGLTLNF